MTKQLLLNFLQQTSKEKPIQLEKLSLFAHMESRKVKRIVQELRHSGERIAGDEDGYYWAKTPEEMLSVRNIMLAHIKSRQETIKAIEQTIERMKHDRSQDNLF